MIVKCRWAGRSWPQAQAFRRARSVRPDDGAIRQGQLLATQGGSA